MGTVAIDAMEMLHLRIDLYALLFTCVLTVACGGSTPSRAEPAELKNPYEKVDWQTFAHYGADLHVHTLQSDGCHSVDEVVRTFHNAGFAILSITDHDGAKPNQCRTRDAAPPRLIDLGLYADHTSPYPDPRPPSFPANTTWPWSDFGAPSPAKLGMLGIEGAELTCGDHVGSFFNGYGVPSCEGRPLPWMHNLPRWGVEVASRS